MASISGINIDVGSVMSGIGSLAKDIRAAITGESVIDSTKKAELLMKVQELEFQIQSGTIAVAASEAASSDKWTSRARPSFMYVIYIFILWSLLMGFAQVFFPAEATVYTNGVNAWLKAMPQDLYALFGAGYLGYGAFRSYDKKTSMVCK